MTNSEEINGKIASAAYDQARKITDLATKVANTTDHPDKYAVIFSKWESKSITDNQSSTIYMTERSLPNGESIPLLGLFTETRQPHPGLLSDSLPFSSDTTMYRHYSLESLLRYASNPDTSNYISKSFPSGTFIAINPGSLEPMSTLFESQESFDNLTFQRQMYLILMAHASGYSKSSAEYVIKNISRNDNLPHPEDNYNKLFSAR